MLVEMKHRMQLLRQPPAASRQPPAAMLVGDLPCLGQVAAQEVLATTVLDKALRPPSGML